MIPASTDQVFLRTDLQDAYGPVTWVRLPKELRDFLNTCRMTHGDIEAFILTKENDDASGNYHWNLGICMPEKEDDE